MNGGGNGSPDHCKDFVPWNKGKTGCYTEEARRRMSEGRRGIPVSEAQRKQISEAKKGFIPVNRKPVLMFNRNGDFVAEFPSERAAAMYLGITVMNVSNVLRGKHKFAGGGNDRKAGYTFKYKNENPDR